MASGKTHWFLQNIQNKENRPMETKKIHLIFQKINFNLLFQLAPYLCVFLFMYFFKSGVLALLSYNGCLLLAIILNRKNIPFKSVFRVKNMLIPVVSVIISGSAGFILYLLWPLIKPEGSTFSSILNTFGIHQGNIIPVVAYFTLVHPVIEELYWRYILKPKTRWISSSEALFAGYHVLVLLWFTQWYFAAAAFLGLILIARIWRFLKDQKSENLAVFLSHSVADFSILLCTGILAGLI